MSNFYYVADNRDGVSQKGQITAADKMTAINELIEKGFTIKKISNKEIDEDESLFSFTERISTEELEGYFISLKALQVSKIPVVELMDDFILKCKSPKMRKVLEEVKFRSENGQKPHQAYAGLNLIPDICINMLRVGDRSGKMDIAYGRVAKYMYRKTKQSNLLIKQALYPSAVFIVVITLLMVMMKFYFPNLQTGFGDLKVQLPWITRFMIGVSQVLNAHFVMIIAVLIGFTAYIANIKRLHRRFADTVCLALSLYKNVKLLDFFEAFLSLYQSGEMVDACVLDASKTLGNTVLEEILEKTVNDVRNGVKLADAIARNDPKEYFDFIFLAMIKAGQRSGQVDEQVSNIISMLEQRVARDMERLPEIMKICLYIPLGLIVGAVVLSGIIPVYSMYELNSALRNGG